MEKAMEKLSLLRKRSTEVRDMCKIHQTTDGRKHENYFALLALFIYYYLFANFATPMEKK